METAEKKCPECQVVMQQGIIIDHTYANLLASAWHPWPVEFNKFFGFDVGKSHGMKLDRTRMLQVSSFRCPQCGLLRNYAFQDSTAS